MKLWKKLRSTITIPANFSSNLIVILPKDFNQWRLKDRIPDEGKYVIYNPDLNCLIKAPVSIVIAFLYDLNPVFNSPSSSSYLPSTSSSQIDLKCNTSNTSNSIMNRCKSTETALAGIQTETQKFPN